MNIRPHYSNKVVQALLAAAKRAKENIECGSGRNDSLCPLIDWYLADYSGLLLWQREAAADLRSEIYRAWPEWSGVSHYPVPSPAEDTDLLDCINNDTGRDPVDWSDNHSAAAGFFDAVDRHDLYDGDFYDEATEYGRSRLRLLDFLITTLENA